MLLENVLRRVGLLIVGIGGGGLALAACASTVQTPDGDDGIPDPDDGWVCQPYANCNPGDVQVDECTVGRVCYTAYECDVGFLCQRPADCPTGTPTCPAGSTPLGDPAHPGSFCGDAPNCSLVESCGTTIACMGACEPATCEPGEVVVDACPPGATCTQRFGCNSIVECAVASTCPAPACDPGDLQVGPAECASDSSCYVVSVCGNDVSCIVPAPNRG